MVEERKRCLVCDRLVATEDQTTTVVQSVRDSGIDQADPAVFEAGVCYGDFWQRHIDDCASHAVDWRARCHAAEAAWDDSQTELDGLKHDVMELHSNGVMGCLTAHEAIADANATRIALQNECGELREHLKEAVALLRSADPDDRVVQAAWYEAVRPLVYPDASEVRDRASLHTVQVQQHEWSLRNFGEHPVWMPVMGCAEEVGELSHAVLKRAQEIRGTKEDHDAAIRDAVADIVIFACDVANVEGFDLEAEVIATWERVRKRDWKANPADATCTQGDSP